MSKRSPTSPPPIPADEAFTSKRCRFTDTGFPSEWSEDYRPGGFHPVHLNDKLKEGRYEVVRKLGNGSYSTVWLAFDSQDSTFVAIKIMRARNSGNNSSELSIIRHLAEKAKDDSLAKYVVTLLDRFETAGPNGIHSCLVFEPMGPSTASMVDELPCNKPKTRGKRSRYPKAMAKMILKHAISALGFVHRHGITHGDVQPGNLLFSIADLSSIGEDQLRQDQSTLSDPLHRVDGKADLWAPRYLALGQPLHGLVQLEPATTVVKLSDFGAAFRTAELPLSTVTPIRLRAPELILRESFDSGIDIWAIGCLVYELLTGTSLFAVDLLDEHQEEADDDHILDLIDVLGPLPDGLMSKWPQRSKWIGPEGERLHPDEREASATTSEADDSSISASSIRQRRNDRPEDTEETAENELLDDQNVEISHQGDDSEPSLPLPAAEQGDEDSPVDPVADEEYEEAGEDTKVNDHNAFINDPLEVLFDRNKPSDIDQEEAKVITSLIREILQYEPTKRRTAEQLLQHSWLQI